MTNTRKAGYQKNGKYYVWCRDHYEEVNKDVYDIIMQDEWREAKRKQRAWRCREKKGKRCEKNCDECEVYRFGAGPNGNIASLESLYEEGDWEPAADTDVEGTVIWAILFDQLMKELEQYMPDGRQIAEMLIEELTEKEMAGILGIPVNTLQHHKKKQQEKDSSQERGESLQA